jgi:hypothetical protein
MRSIETRHGQEVMRGAAFLAALSIAAAALPLRAQELALHEHGLSFSSDGAAVLVPSQHGVAAFRGGAWRDPPGQMHVVTGFAVTERAMYSSGYAHEEGPARRPLGLLKSADGAKTWRPIALAGEAQFPHIGAGHASGAIYVLNTQANSSMPAPGIYATNDEGKRWRRAAARGLQGEIQGLAAHPREPGTVAVATDRGLYLSRDAGDRFERLYRRQPATAVTFDHDGGHVLYLRTLSNEMVAMALAGRRQVVLRLPPLSGDFVTHIAHHPTDDRMLAFATRRRHVYLSDDGGRSWRQIAKDGDLP